MCVLDIFDSEQDLVTKLCDYSKAHLRSVQISHFLRSHFLRGF